MAEKLDKTVTATKSTVSGGVAAGGYGIGSVIVLIAKWRGIDISTETALLIAGVIGTAVAGAGRAVENAVRFYAKLKKIAVEK
jgi:hypothetical protein